MLLKQKKKKEKKERKKENIALQLNNNNCIFQKPAPILFTPSQERHLIFYRSIYCRNDLALVSGAFSFFQTV